MELLEDLAETQNLLSDIEAAGRFYSLAKSQGLGRPPAEETKFFRRCQAKGILPVPIFKSVNDNRFVYRCRKLTSDTWLYNNTDNAKLGRILSNQVIDENRLKITTSEGVYIVNAAMRVLRGKSEKKSIHGHIVSVYSLMD